jgi:hypothetical protein
MGTVTCSKDWRKRPEQTAAAHLACTKHGHSPASGRSQTYTSWQSMLSRCIYRKHSPVWRHYGGRGIKVCDRWMQFANFLADMGERPNGKTLDRFPNQNGNYEPGNCRWATRKEQADNSATPKILVYAGLSLSIADWSRRLGATNLSLVGKRLRRGWTLERAVTEPVPTRGGLRGNY